MSEKKSAKRFVCIHGHFYQPYRKNPQTGEIGLQEGAYPFKDWNEKINAECYRANAFAHILGKDNKLADIINNYAKISFNFGPTLLDWIQKNDAQTYKKIIEADKCGKDLFSGHGTAIAQTYSHLIMPLANRQDKILQVFWAIYNFEKNFNRKPEGMWLAETAVDYKTLEVLAEFNIKYTILSPYQAYRYRKIKNILHDSEKRQNGKTVAEWILTENGSINTRRPYLCRLPSGKKIVIFFYDKEISTAVSFGDLLKNGEAFAQNIIQTPYSNETDIAETEKEIIVVSSDGEVYGHHKKFGEMALAYCLKTLQENKDIELTVFGEYLDLFPPVYEVEIIENTAWSCSHYLSRWEGGCTCGLPENHPESQWTFKWRDLLRQAIKEAREEFDKIFFEQINLFVPDRPSGDLAVLKDYICVFDQRNYRNIRQFLDKYLPRNSSGFKNNDKNKDNLINNFFTDEDGLLLSLLEMQRQAILMQSSDAWFFDDISRIEAVQIFRHFLMAVRLSGCFDVVKSRKIFKSFLNILKTAKSNIVDEVNGFEVFIKKVTRKEYTTEKIAADFIVNYYYQLACQKKPGKAVKNQIFEFYNHELILAGISDFEDECFFCMAGGLYVRSKITLKKEFCSFFFIIKKYHDFSDEKKGEFLRIIIRKKDGGFKNNHQYSPETDDFIARIKNDFKKNDIQETFFALKNKPGFKYFDTKDINKRIKIDFFNMNTDLKLKELGQAVSGLSLLSDSLENDLRKWVNTDYLKEDNTLLNNIMIQSRISAILSKKEINKSELEELEHLADRDTHGFMPDALEAIKRRSRNGILIKNAENLLIRMARKYLENITETEILSDIIKLSDIYKKLDLEIDFLKMQNIIFELKGVFKTAVKVLNNIAIKEIQDKLLILFERFEIAHSKNDSF